ncbi:sulfatase-like hydrolase/transferase [Amycolatopsis sp. NPDC051903]|uniref:sulfatase-like hydrolase/transferase n=1 Tax=Amycolatopsis sp. NPDC051903 TaxID=3363936 RepID=UPI0037A5D8B8
MPSQPNVLIVCADHWAGGLLGAAGHPAVQTPTLDALAASGTRFSRAYSESPVCVPARRTLMTGTTPRTHGDRTFQQDLPMPNLPTLAQTFRDHGYQAHAVGKLHVFPQRARIGFDDVLLAEEGRRQWGVADDYEAHLAERGYVGQLYAHGMSNNQYTWRPWHLPEELHQTSWASRQMARVIQRRDPTRPALWYLSYTAPHPPVTPPAEYLDLYDPDRIDLPVTAPWSADPERLPHQLRRRIGADSPIGFSEHDVRMARRAFYAQCTYIDHQLRVVIGTLREEGLLDDTIIVFTADHGDMLGDHNLWAKRVFYERSANVPMLVLGRQGDPRVRPGTVDDRLVGLQDVMPTVLDLAGLPVPETVEGRSMAGAPPREVLYGEYGEGPEATRMVHDGRYKLIYYPVGNHVQLFDVGEDDRDRVDLAGDPAYAGLRDKLLGHLAEQLYGTDAQWLRGGELVGLPDEDFSPVADRGLSQQRGLH